MVNICALFQICQFRFPGVRKHIQELQNSYSHLRTISSERKRRWRNRLQSSWVGLCSHIGFFSRHFETNQVFDDRSLGCINTNLDLDRCCAIVVSFMYSHFILTMIQRKWTLNIIYDKQLIIRAFDMNI